MELYGSGASIGQANAQTEMARQLNNATNDFNNSLAEQLDQAKIAENEEQTDITTKNMVSVGSAGGKLLLSSEARGDVKGLVKSVKGVPSLIVSKTPTNVFNLGVESSADLAPGAAERGASVLAGEGIRGGTDVAPAIQRGVQSSADVAEGAAERGAALLAGEGAEEGGTALLESGGAGRLAAVGGLKKAAELGAKDFAKGTIAGVGGGLDIIKDIERGNFGSNKPQVIGNIGNIVGSALEVAGVLTAWTPFGIGLEGAGALISLGSSALETGGDIAEGAKQSEKTESDIQSQARGEVVSEQVEQAVGRTQ